MFVDKTNLTLHEEVVYQLRQIMDSYYVSALELVLRPNTKVKVHQDAVQNDVNVLQL